MATSEMTNSSRVDGGLGAGRKTCEAAPRRPAGRLASSAKVLLGIGVDTGLMAIAVGCAALPTVTYARTDAERQSTVEGCLRAFPEIPWSATHTIDASLPFDNNALFIGVTTMDANATHSVLMSPEGLVVFDGIDSNGRLALQRALPPLDKPDFGRGLIADVRQAFARPPQAPDRVGITPQGMPICRWHLKEDKTVDVELRGGEPAWIRGYSGNSLEREVQLSDPVRPGRGWYRQVVLRAPGAAGYTLRMRLMDHDGPDASSEGAQAVPQNEPPTKTVAP